LRLVVASGKAVTSTSYASTILHFRRRCAWRRTLADALGGRYRPRSPCSHGAAGWNADGTRAIARVRGRSWNTAARRFMDADCRSAGGVPRAVAGLLVWTSVALGHDGNPVCRLGTDRTGRLVARCPPFRVEAPRDSGSKEATPTPLVRPSACPQRGYHQTLKRPAHDTVRGFRLLADGSTVTTD